MHRHAYTQHINSLLFYRRSFCHGRWFIGFPKVAPLILRKGESERPLLHQKFNLGDIEMMRNPKSCRWSNQSNGIEHSIKREYHSKTYRSCWNIRMYRPTRMTSKLCVCECSLAYVRLLLISMVAIVGGSNNRLCVEKIRKSLSSLLFFASS